MIHIQRPPYLATGQVWVPLRGSKRQARRLVLVGTEAGRYLVRWQADPLPRPGAGVSSMTAQAFVQWVLDNDATEIAHAREPGTPPPELLRPLPVDWQDAARRLRPSAALPPPEIDTADAMPAAGA